MNHWQITMVCQHTTNTTTTPKRLPTGWFKAHYCHVCRRPRQVVRVKNPDHPQAQETLWPG